MTVLEKTWVSSVPRFLAGHLCRISRSTGASFVVTIDSEPEG